MLYLHYLRQTNKKIHCRQTVRDFQAGLGFEGWNRISTIFRVPDRLSH